MRQAVAGAVLGLAATFAVTPSWAAPLSLQDFLQGRLSASGTLENYREKTRRDFTMAMQASWAGDQGTLVEDVAFADGERQHKVWRFERTAPGHFIGRREDLTREASIEEDATGITMSYKARTPVPSGETYNLAFEDRLVPRDARTVAVTSDITYFLVPVGRITMTVTKPAAK